jgi:hypothetical protein
VFELQDFATLGVVFFAVSEQSMRHQPSAADSGIARADELFRTRLENQIDLRHPLAQLAGRMPWTELEGALSVTLPPAPVRGGRPALPVRLMARQKKGDRFNFMTRDIQPDTLSATTAAGQPWLEYDDDRLQRILVRSAIR